MSRTKSFRLLIRADASTSIGSGHVARCLAVAQALHAQAPDGLDVQIAFACCELSGNAIDQIAAQGFAVLRLPAYTESIGQEIDWKTDIAAIRKQADWFDAVIVDHYGLDARWEAAARQHFARNIVVIDDLANRPHDADVLLDQNLTAAHSAYVPRWVSEDCQLFLGPRYALLRPAFCNAVPIDIRPHVQHILVNFGGVDPTGETLKTMQALAAMPQLTAIKVTFVAGRANPAWDALLEKARLLPAFLRQQQPWQLHRHVEDFAALMRQADLFIGAGGGTVWERAALGLPSMCIAVAKNQRANAQAMALRNAHCYLGESGIGESANMASHLQQQLAELLVNHARRQQYAEESCKLIDGGQGMARFITTIINCC